MTVSRLRGELGAGEFILWSRYYARIEQRKELERGAG